jgi:uncharacterized protein YerC
MNMDKRPTATIIISLFFGVIIGYSANYLTIQPQVNTLNTELAAAKLTLANTTTALNQKNDELTKKNTETLAQTAQIATLMKQIEDLRTQLTEDENTTIAKLNIQVEALTAQLQETQSAGESQAQTIKDLTSKNITVTAKGSGLVQDSGVDVPTNRTLSMFITWTKAGWSGTGYYTVTATNNNTAIGLEAGYVYILDVYTLDNVTITDNTLNATGTVSLTDRASTLLGAPLQITGTANNDGKPDDPITVTWPTITSNATLLGTIKINSPIP